MAPISLPPMYDGRSALDKWLQRFDICANANGWDDSVKGAKLPVFLEGEALVVYLELSKDRRTYAGVKAALTAAFTPPELRSEYLLAFEKLSMRTGESPRSFMFELRRLLDIAIPDLDAVARETLLYHHFINGLPQDISVAIKTSHDCVTSEAALKRALTWTHVKEVPPRAAAAATDGAAIAVTRDASDLALRLADVERDMARLRPAGTPTAPGTSAVRAFPRKRAGSRRYPLAQNIDGGSKDIPSEPQCLLCLGFGHRARQCANNALITSARQQQGRPRMHGRGGSGERSNERLVEHPLCGSAVTFQHSSDTATIDIKIGDAYALALLDSGSTRSLITEKLVRQCYPTTLITRKLVGLRTAANQPFDAIGLCNIGFSIGDRDFIHEFLVVRQLVTDVILGTDFLRAQNASLHFKNPSRGASNGCVVQWPERAPVSAASVTSPETDADVDEDAVVPLFCASDDCVRPPVAPSPYERLLQQHSELFRLRPGSTSLVYHHISTGENAPVRVPGRRIPMHWRDKIMAQLDSMLKQGIIRPSSSPWLAPAVYTAKKNGDIRIAVDYRELNKRTVKDSYPLPLPDEIQDRLHGSRVYSTLDLNSGYWQVPVRHEDVAKTAFTPGPGLGAYEFLKMPFGLTGAPATFQRLMDTLLGDLPYVFIYLDDALIHSSCESEHIQHLGVVFSFLQQAGLTLSGAKCHIAQSQVHYLGHVFDQHGMRPDPAKVQSVREWPPPTSASELRAFLGLASYYRRFVCRFAELSAPLNDLLCNGEQFRWQEKHQQHFDLLKDSLTTAPILHYPSRTDTFVVTTDASNCGLGAILEQGGKVIAFKSRALSASEKNYSTIQKECLALLYALKEFRHYLLGRRFVAVTDHNPLVWLTGQKAQGVLARWAIVMQEFDFDLQYRRGELNTNADALSRHPLCGQPVNTTPLTALVEVQPSDAASDIRCEQLRDPVLQIVMKAVEKGRYESLQHRGTALHRFWQMRKQLKLVDGVLYRYFRPHPACEPRYAVIVPLPNRSDYLRRYHDIAGHQGVDRTYDKLRDNAYWVGMARDTADFCRSCQICQQTKGGRIVRQPLVPVPVGRPWEMVAMDMLKVTMSVHGREYLLVLQDYFTKWVEAIPVRDASAATVESALLSVFSRFGMPRLLHSDQGSNFESEIVRNLCRSLGIEKTRTTPYHPQGDGMVERTNSTLLTMLRTSCMQAAGQWEDKLPLILFAYRTSRHRTTGFSPFELMFGRVPEDSQNFAERMHTHGTTPAAHHDSLAARLAEYREWVDAQLAECTANTEQRGPSMAPCAYHPGDPVWLWDSAPRHKLAPRWLGGWRVDTMLGPVTVRLVNDVGHHKVVHVDKLKARIPRISAPPALTFVEEQPAEQHPNEETSSNNEPSISAERPTQNTDGVEASIETPPRRTSERSHRLPARLADYDLG